MSNAGGSSTANGILHQVLRTLTVAGELRTLSALDSSASEASATLIVEPRGGDLSVVTANDVFVEQIKERSTGGTWSLRELIEKVISDLVLAAVERPECNRFRFLAGGRAGKWPKRREFLDLFTSGGTSSDLHDQHDIPSLRSLIDRKPKKGNGSTPKPFWNGVRPTAKGLFECCIRECRKDGQLRTVGDKELAPAVYRVLQGPETDFSLDADRIRTEIGIALRGAVTYRKQIEPKIDELIGVILGATADGPKSLTPDEVFSKVGISRPDLRDAATLMSNARNSADRFGRSHNYETTHDVRLGAFRELVDAVTASPIVCVVGPSGYGKTWRTAAAAVAMCSNGFLPVCISASGASSADEILDRAARKFCNEIRTTTHDGPIAWQTLVERISDEHAANELRLVLVVEQLSDRDVATELSRRTTEVGNSNKIWKTVLVCHPHIAPGGGSLLDGKTQTIEVVAFSEAEVQDLLQRRGYHDWDILSSDTRRLLRVPILADAFLRGGRSGRHRTESELLDNVVHVVLIRGGTRTGGVLKTFRSVAASVRREVRQPIPEALLNEEPSSDDLGEALASGILERTADGLSFRHARYLAYAMADHIAIEAINGQRTIDEVVQNVQSICDRHTSGVYLPAVANDIIFLLATRYQRPDTAAQIATAMEASHRTGFDGDLFDDLHKLGDDGLPTLRAIFRQASVHVDLREIGKRLSPEDQGSRAVARPLLESDDPNQNLAGLAIAEAVPDSSLIDPVWALHQRIVADLKLWQIEHVRPDYKVREASSAALAACAGTQPDWLLSAISEVASCELAESLGWVVLRLPIEQGSTIWKSAFPLLLEKTPQSPGLFAAGISQYPDIEHFDDVERLCSASGLEGRAPIAATAILPHEPERAWRLIRSSTLLVLQGYAAYWCAPFWADDADRYFREVRSLIEQDGLAALPLLRSTVPIPSEVLAAILEAAAEAVENWPEEDDKGRLGFALEDLPKVQSKGWIELAGSELFQRLDESLVGAVADIPPNPSPCDVALDPKPYAVFSALVGGEATVAAIRRGFSHSAYMAQHKTTPLTFHLPGLLPLS